MVITVFGSRNLFGPAVKEIIDKEIKQLNPEYIVTAGDADGVCKEAREYCRVVTVNRPTREGNISLNPRVNIPLKGI